MLLVGDKSKIAFEFGSYWEDSLQNQHISVWLGDKCITSVDNLMYLPTFYNNLKGDIEKLENMDGPWDVESGSYECQFALLEDLDADYCRVLLFDLTTMSARCYYLGAESPSYVLFSFWDKRHQPAEEIGRVFRVFLEKDEIISVLSEALNQVSTKWY